MHRRASGILHADPEGGGLGLMSIALRFLFLLSHAVMSAALTCIFEHYCEHDDRHCSIVKGGSTEVDSPSPLKGHKFLLFLTFLPTLQLLWEKPEQGRTERAVWEKPRLRLDLVVSQGSIISCIYFCVETPRYPSMFAFLLEGLFFFSGSICHMLVDKGHDDTRDQRNEGKDIRSRL